MKNITSTNGKSFRDSRTHWLDKALEGKPPSVKARVLEIILKMGIDPEDEFFIIFVALGQLQVLIEDSPNDWKNLFAEFERELDEWATTNVETLSQLNHKTEALEELAQSFDKLGNYFGVFTEICRQQMRESQTSERCFLKYLSNLQDSSVKLMSGVQSLREELSQQGALSSAKEHQVERLSQSLARFQKEYRSSHQQLEQNLDSCLKKLNQWSSFLQERQNQRWAWKSSWLVVLLIYLVIHSAGFWIMALIYLRDRADYQQLRIKIGNTSIRTMWLLEKANRRDCLDGIKKMDSPECSKLLQDSKNQR